MFLHMDRERYSRQIILQEIGEDGQRRLNDASVLIVGLGGLGAPVATYLTGAGIGRIGLADNDIVSISNLQRQTLYTNAEVGRRKVEMAKRRLMAQSPTTVFELHPDGLTEQNADGVISKYDIVVDCCDNFSTRFLIDNTCARFGKPWVHGAIGGFVGQVAVFNYKRGRRYRDLYPEGDWISDRSDIINGVVGVVPSIVGSLQASEVLKIIVGYGEVLDGRLFTIDTKTLDTNLIEI